MRVAAAAFPLRPFRDFVDFAAVFRDQAASAAAAGARLVVFPEYLAGGLLGIDRRWSVWEEPLLTLARAVAREQKLFVLAGTHPWRDGRRLVNRAHLVAPDGGVVSASPPDTKPRPPVEPSAEGAQVSQHSRRVRTASRCHSALITSIRSC